MNTLLIGGLAAAVLRVIMWHLNADREGEDVLAVVAAGTGVLSSADWPRSWASMPSLFDPIAPERGPHGAGQRSMWGGARVATSGIVVVRR